jgi:AdoMet-dependent rRNA methyltransferase SPB1
MGKMSKHKDVSTTFEVAPAVGDEGEEAAPRPDRDSDDEDEDNDDAMDMGFGPMSKVDDRTYGSDEEDYDTYDKTMTLALGTMMLRGSRKKAMVDASYNRYAWNDPKDLPGWFADDEMKHNRPQLPVPNALIQQIKGKFTKTGTKEIKKVAEARMRKRKRAEIKLKSAKKEAKTAAENPDLSDKMKVRAISRAMKGTKADKPSKVYVVARGANSTGKSSGGSGKMKFVDSRMKNDSRAMKRNEKKAKKFGRKSKK